MVMVTEQKKKVIVIPATKKKVTEEKNERILNVAAYARVSTDDPEQLTSYEAQIQYYTDLICQNKHWRLVKIFADEGRSGTNTKRRPEFNEMIELCQQGKIDIILSKSISRFARNITDCILTIRELKDKGIAVIFEKEHINTLDISSEMMIALHSTFAQAESESISENVKWGKRKRFERGEITYQYKYWYGYKKGEDGRPEIIPEEAVFVREIYDKYLDGWSLDGIRDDLNQKGIHTRRGKKWSKVTIQRILTNEKYKGAVLLQKTFVANVLTKEIKKNTGELTQYYFPEAHTPLIPPELFDKVQEEIARRTSKRSASPCAKTVLGKYNSKYALSEIMECGACGTKYRRITWNIRGKKKIMWRCVNRVENGKMHCMESPSIEEPVLHEAIVQAINRFRGNADDIKQIFKKNIVSVLAESTNSAYKANTYILKERIDSLQAEMIQLVMQGVSNGLDRSAIEAECESKTLELKKLKQLQKDKQQAKNMFNAAAGDELEHIFQIIDSYQDLDSYNDLLVRRIIEKIVILSKDKIAITFSNGYELTQELGESGYETNCG